jgi:hypothetical protein
MSIGVLGPKHIAVESRSKHLMHWANVSDDEEWEFV